MIVNTGLDALLDIFIGSPQGTTPFSLTSSYMGVGDDSTEVDATQTFLQAYYTTGNYLVLATDTGYPYQVGINQLNFQSTFGPNDANFSWREWVILNGSDIGAVMFNRVAQYVGTKLLGQTWVLSVELIFTIGS